MPAKSRKEQILEMLAGEPNDAFLRYALAMEYNSEGDGESAVRTFRELIAADAGYVSAYFQCGQTLAKLGRPGEAREVLQAGIAAAQRKGEFHTAEEMQAFLLTLGDV